MIFKLDNGKEIDTDALSSEDRHIIQKLLAWQSLVDSVTNFREKKKQALQAGWNNSGPVREHSVLSLIFKHMEKQIRIRLEK